MSSKRISSMAAATKWSAIRRTTDRRRLALATGTWPWETASRSAIGDDIPTDDNSADLRNLIGGFMPVLADGLRTARGYPVASSTPASPAQHPPMGHPRSLLLQLYPDRDYFLLMYGHNDCERPEAERPGAHSAKPGYAGSFKDYMQRIIDAVRAAGKVALLSKLRPSSPQQPHEHGRSGDTTGDRRADANPANGISAVPPDFYTYFSSRRRLTTGTTSR